MSGIQEILVLVLIVLAIFFLPRIVSRGKKSGRAVGRKRSDTIRRLSGRMRLAILASVAWPLGTALFFNPLSGGVAPFFYVGVMPVLLAWGLAWVAVGYRRGPRQGR